MRYGLWLPTTLMALLLVGCGDEGDNIDPPPAHLSDCTTADGDPFDLAETELDGDTLSVTVQYGGGCADHDFVLCWPDQAFAESNPVQAGLELWHDAHGDLCEAYVTETITFGLSELEEAWHDSYGAGSGTIIVKLGGDSHDYVF